MQAYSKSLASSFIILAFAITTISCSSTDEKSTAIVLIGGTLIDGTGRPPIPDSVVIIDGERILQAGSNEEVVVPVGAQVISTSGKYVIPGLADMHNHLGDGTFGPPPASEDWPRNLARLLSFGITMVFSPEMHDMEGFAQIKGLSKENPSHYPHFFGVGHWLTAQGGLDWQKGYSPETPEEARKAIRELKSANVDAVKFVYSDNTYALSKPNPMLSSSVMSAIVDEAHNQGLKAYVHAPILKYAKEVLRAGGDGIVHGIISDPIDEEFLNLMKQNRAVYTTTHSIFVAASDLAGWGRRVYEFNDQESVPSELVEVGLDPSVAEDFEANIDNLAFIKNRIPILQANTKKAWENGLLVVAGSDNNHGGSGILLGLSSQLELVLLVEAGLEPIQALQAATINAAKMIGREEDFGSVEAGKVADLVILDADPLENIGNIKRVFKVIKGGVVHEPENISSSLN